MSGSAKRRKGQWIVTLLILLEGAVITLHGVHVISTTWTIGLFFLLIIPGATLKAFADYRSADISD